MGWLNLLLGTGHDDENGNPIGGDEELYDSAPGMSVEELAKLAAASQEQRKDLKQVRDINRGINWDEDGGDEQWKDHVKKSK